MCPANGIVVVEDVAGKSGFNLNLYEGQKKPAVKSCTVERDTVEEKNVLPYGNIR